MGVVALGIDVADGGNDKNVISIVKKEIILASEKEMFDVEIDREFIGMNTMVFTGELITRVKQLKDGGLEIDVMVIDKVGVGAGVWRRLIELTRDKTQDWYKGLDIVGVNTSEGAREEGFANLRAEIWWKMRRAYEERQVRQKKHDGLKQDLATPRWERDSKGKVILEAKKKIIKKLGRSPDYGDAVSYGFLGAMGYAREPRIRVLGG